MPIKEHPSMGVVMLCDPPAFQRSPGLVSMGRGKFGAGATYNPQATPSEPAWGPQSPLRGLVQKDRLATMAMEGIR